MNQRTKRIIFSILSDIKDQYDLYPYPDEDQSSHIRKYGQYVRISFPLQRMLSKHRLSYIEMQKILQNLKKEGLILDYHNQSDYI